MSHKPHSLLLLLALLCAGDAAALGLGQITVLSRLGARFQAEVELLGLPADNRPIAECFRLSAPGNPESGIPALTQGRVTIERQGNRVRLLISSDQFISDPILQISIRAGCGAEVVRDYMLIIDPLETKAAKPATSLPATSATSKIPVTVDSRPAAAARPASDAYPDRWQASDGESAQSITRHLFPRQPSAQRRFLKALQLANPEIDMGVSGETPLSAGTPLTIPDTRRGVRPVKPLEKELGRPVVVEQPLPAEPAPVPAPVKKEKRRPAAALVSTDRMSDRLSISGTPFEEGVIPDGLPLRLANELSSRTMSKTSESQRAMFRMEYKLLTAIYDQASQQLSLAEQVRQLEASVAELQAASENSAREAAQAAAQAKIAATQRPPAKEVTAPPASPSNEEATDHTSWWAGLALLIALIGVLVWALRRYSIGSMRFPLRPGAENAPPEAEEPLPWSISDDIFASTPNAKMASDKVQSPFDNDWPPVTPQTPAPTPAPDIVVEVLPETVTIAEPMLEPIVVKERDEFNPVMELADIMLSFGRVKGATQALLEYIENNPDEALQPWIKLLEIYRQNGMREDYESLSQKVKLHFNIQPGDWDTIPDLPPQPVALEEDEAAVFEALLSRLPNIGQIPHIKDAISHTWDTPEGIVYLNKLLRDNRQGARRGFSLSVVSELMFLLDILEKRGNKAPSDGAGN